MRSFRIRSDVTYTPQNADDAGARTISFCIDARHHGTSSLAFPGLAQYQVPVTSDHSCTADA